MTNEEETKTKKPAKEPVEIKPDSDLIHFVIAAEPTEKDKGKESK